MQNLSIPEEKQHTVPQPAKEREKERLFLEGPRSRTKELWNIARIGWEFLRVFRVLHFVGPCVTVFGSARFTEGHEYYELTRRVGAGIADVPDGGTRRHELELLILRAQRRVNEVRRAVRRAGHAE